ncbi:MAG: hypothetical protein SVM80_13880, partial [Halobacteriota archaeon]|nr:hypothetical protein [Halobacteriota archaeon]
YVSIRSSDSLLPVTLHPSRSAGTPASALYREVLPTQACDPRGTRSIRNSTVQEPIDNKEATASKQPLKLLI